VKAAMKSLRRMLFLSVGLMVFFSLAFADEIRYDSGDRRDPFIPLVGEGAVLSKGFDPSALNVQGIIIDPREGPSALINGDLYKEGEHVQNANIIHIFNDRVIFSQDDEEKTIWIREEIVEGQPKNEPEKAQEPS